jgi:hypothetical protein
MPATQHVVSRAYAVFVGEAYTRGASPAPQRDQ